MGSRTTQATHKALDAVVSYAERRGMQVHFSRGARDEFDPVAMIISINSKNQLHDQLHVLLHELGHWLISAQSARREKSWPRGYFKGNHASAKSLLSRVDIVLEEVEAWDRGWRLAKRLRLPVDPDLFTRSRARRLSSYFSWTLKVNNKKPKVSTAQ